MVVEVKDTVNALRAKLAAGTQNARIIQWISGSSPQQRRAAQYFVRDGTVGFQDVLDNKILSPMTELEGAMGAAGTVALSDYTLCVGGQRFRVAELRALEQAALTYLKAYRADHRGANLNVVAAEVFGSVSGAKKAAAEGYKKEEGQ